MQKLVTKNPVQKFKQGRKIVKAQNGWFSTLLNVSNTINPLTNNGFTLLDKIKTTQRKQRELQQKLQENQQYSKEQKARWKKLEDDAINKRGRYSKSNKEQTKPLVQSNKKTTVQPTAMVTPTEQTLDIKPVAPMTIVPQNTDNTVQGNEYSFTLPKANIQTTTEVPMLTPPEARDYNTDNIRAMRGTYSDVDQYFDYIRNNSNSNEARLWDNMWYGVDDWNKRRQIFDETMKLHGISNNLGRRDSGRLANLHNLLRRITVPGSESEIGFRNGLYPYNTMPQYNNNSDYINWRDALNLRYTNPFVSYAKQGSKLVSKNPIERFKRNFMKVDQ